MDITSYLLGKKSSGGGGSGLDWSAIGYSGEPGAIQESYDYALEVKNNWVPAISCSYKFNQNYNLVFMPMVDTSITTDVSDMFNYCTSLLSVPLFDTSNVTTTSEMFMYCDSLKEVPLFNTSKATTIRRMFSNCRSLKKVPILDTSSVSASNGMQQVFSTCLSLTDQSLDNILQMCINATSYTGTKTLKELGFASYEGYPVSRIQALPHYQDFINAGWTIGY